MELWDGYNSDKDLLLRSSGIFAGGRCFVIPRFYTILGDRQRENEVKALCNTLCEYLVIMDYLFILNCLDLLCMDRC